MHGNQGLFLTVVVNNYLKTLLNLLPHIFQIFFVLNIQILYFIKYVSCLLWLNITLTIRWFSYMLTTISFYRINLTRQLLISRHKLALLVLFLPIIKCRLHIFVNMMILNCFWLCLTLWWLDNMCIFQILIVLFWWSLATTSDYSSHLYTFL